MYENSGSDIFHRSLWHRITALDNLIEEKYPAEDMSRVIKAISARCMKKSVLEEKPIPIRHNRSAHGVHM